MQIIFSVTHNFVMFKDCYNLSEKDTHVHKTGKN